MIRNHIVEANATLSQMLQQPLQQTVLTLSETIDFLVDNDFLDHTELKPGQAQEQAEKLAKLKPEIVVMDS